MIKYFSSPAAYLTIALSICGDFCVQEHLRCFSFCLQSFSHRQHRLSRNSHPSSIVWAKPPPTSNFDLASVEAFEAIVDCEDNLHSIDDFNNGDDQSLSVEDNNTRILFIPQHLDGKRLDAALAALMEPQLSRSACGKMIADGCVNQVTIEQAKEIEILLNRKSFKAEAGMILRVSMPKNEIPDKIVKQNIPLNIIYEDEHMIVINKDAGMVVHPAAGNWDGTVVNALAYYLANESPYGLGDFVGDVDVDAGTDCILDLRPGIVHRLDKGTTGILIVSKTKETHAILSAAFAQRDVKKTYLAIAVGNPGKRVAIDKAIGRHPVHRQRMRVVPDRNRNNSYGVTPKKKLQYSSSQSGKRAISFVDTLQFDGKLSVVQVRIETGRTHQIRVHLQDRHTPIYGDDVYGISDWNKRLLKAHNIERPLLHAHRLEINHPVTGQHMIFVAPMARDMASIAKVIWPDGVNMLPDAFTKL